MNCRARLQARIIDAVADRMPDACDEVVASLRRQRRCRRLGVLDEVRDKLILQQHTESRGADHRTELPSRVEYA